MFQSIFKANIKQQLKNVTLVQQLVSLSKLMSGKSKFEYGWV